MPEVSKNIDVSFVGTNRPGRMELMRFLNSQGVAVQIWGNSWPKETPNYMGEAIYLDNKRYVYNSSKIVLNHHYLVGVNMRFFEALGNRCFMLSDLVDGIEELGFKEGVHYVSYSNMQDLVEKIHYYLQRPEERQKIARQGHATVRQNHTYIHRVKEVLESI
jgi:spore maturation protein CgeB